MAGGRHKLHSVDIGGQNFRLLFRFDKETGLFFDLDYGNFK